MTASVPGRAESRERWGTDVLRLFSTWQVLLFPAMKPIGVPDTL